MYFTSNLIILCKKLRNHYGFINIFHCMQLDDFTGEKFLDQNNSIFMIWNISH